MKVVELPPTYSESDQGRIDDLKEKLVELDASYRAAAAPIIKDLEKIYARYQHRYVIYSSSPNDVPDSVKTLLKTGS